MFWENWYHWIHHRMTDRTKTICPSIFDLGDIKISTSFCQSQRFSLPRRRCSQLIFLHHGVCIMWSLLYSILLYSLKYVSLIDLGFIDCAIHILYTGNKNQCGLPKMLFEHVFLFQKLKASLLHFLMLILSEKMQYFVDLRGWY